MTTELERAALEWARAEAGWNSAHRALYDADAALLNEVERRFDSAAPATPEQRAAGQALLEVRAVAAQLAEVARRDHDRALKELLEVARRLL